MDSSPRQCLARRRGYGIRSGEMIGRLGHFKLCIYPLTRGYTSKLAIRGSYAKGREDLVPTSGLYSVTCFFFLSLCKERRMRRYPF
ncbi:hypothetical protein GQ55_1G037900 [Panicum hallii var. hallii]|uniref:Uncharacterized protein n=1 Tax=Panicum hallii var. hallii TaxID=1504633 RepID=A0A2T7F1Z1_9POAL|nr:hypothetical protein GQ55_1G037900 [Panicum hallii var. hallii]